VWRRGGAGARAHKSLLIFGPSESVENSNPKMQNLVEKLSYEKNLFRGQIKFLYTHNLIHRKFAQRWSKCNFLSCLLFKSTTALIYTNCNFKKKQL